MFTSLTRQGCDECSARPVQAPSPYDAHQRFPSAGADTTPTTDDKRLPTVLRNTSGFVYYVSITGITGMAIANYDRVGTAVARIKRHTDLPVAVGFGVKTPENAAAIARAADGVVVGTALVDALRASLVEGNRAGPGSVAAVRDLVAALAAGVRSVRRAPAEQEQA